jgi:hypothetical protein
MSEKGCGREFMMIVVYVGNGLVWLKDPNSEEREGI